MSPERVRELLTQGSTEEASKMFKALLQGCVRVGLLETMRSEVEHLCGPAYERHTDRPYRRAGSEAGSAFVGNKREAIRRPRVRHETDGEIRLATYEIASSPHNVFDQVVAAIQEGLPIRGAGRAQPSISKSEASRMWIHKSLEQLQTLRTRSLGEKDWLALLIDGVYLAKEICVVVAIGIDINGDKYVLDFEQGTSESASVCTALLERLKNRGVQPPPERRLLVLRDGSAAIAKAVTATWPDAIQQECLVHAQRNVRDRLRVRDRADLDLHFQRLRQAQGKEAGEERFDELLKFVRLRNSAAAQILQERRAALLAFHHLNVPATLNTTFLSTNLIENTFRNWRQASGQVKRWNESGDMIARWMASGLLWAESGFRKIRHSTDLPALIAALRKKKPEKAEEKEPLSVDQTRSPDRTSGEGQPVKRSGKARQTRRE